MLRTKLKQHGYALALGLILLFLCWRNYTPGTSLTGWDNLHPEFDFAMNINRAIFSVWQEYQGVGLLAGMAHASDLIRELFLFALSPVIAKDFSRYFFHFSMIILGTFGAYMFLKNSMLEKQKSSIRHQAAFLGALFYLLNLGSVQYFFVPFEPYSSFWGFFPWEMYVLFRFVTSPTKRNALLLALVNLLAVSQAYVQTIFLVYILCVVLFLAAHIAQRRSLSAVAISLKVLVIIFCINAFWLLPNLYFTMKDVHVTQNALHNKMDTEKFFQMNKRRGAVSDFVYLKSFNYDLFDTDRITKQTGYLLGVWHSHQDFLLTAFLGLLAFFAVLFGIFHKKTYYRFFFVGLLGFCGLIFLSDTPIISAINDWFRTIPLINQMFRNSFSKCIVPSIFVFTIGFGVSCSLLLNWVSTKKILQKKHVVFLFLTGMILFYGLPAFKGYYIGHQVRVAIPQDYFDLFAYFKTQDKNARIMNLPQGSYWGWGTYQWGQTGSGFLWYGIEQPILDRAFDVWSSQLEGYYWELWNALKKKDMQAFNQVLEKYQVQFILFDPSYEPSDSSPEKVLLQQEDLLKENTKVSLAKQIGKIRVYKVKLDNSFKTNVVIKEQLPLVAKGEQFENKDEAFEHVGYYQAGKENKNTYSFPFGSLFTDRLQEDRQFAIEDSGNTFVLQKKIKAGKYVLAYPSVIANEPLTPVNIAVRRQNNALFVRLSVASPTIKINNQELAGEDIVQEVSMPLTSQSFTDPFLLSLNSQDFFPFEKPTEQYVYLGSSYLINARNANTMRIFTSKNVVRTPLALEQFPPAGECDGKTKNGYVTSSTEKDSYVMYVKNTGACSLYKEALPDIKGPALIKVMFDYRSLTDEYPKYCLSGLETRGCLNTKLRYAKRIGFANEMTPYADYVEADTDITGVKFQLILDAKDLEDKDLLKQIRYKNVALHVYSLVGSVEADIDKSLPQEEKQIPLTLTKDAVLRVEVPKVDNSYSFPHFLTHNMYKQKSTIPANMPTSGEYYFQETKDNGKKAIRVYAKDTLSQFWFKAPNPTANFGYLVQMTTKNVTGFPFIINIFTPEDNNKYVYTMLPRGNIDKTSYFMLPPMTEFDKGMEVLLLNPSYNRAPSVNEIKDISMYPFPYEFVTNISLKDPSASDDYLTTAQTTKGDLGKVPASVKKHNISSYEVVVQAKDRNNVLILSQSYHAGWKAYAVGNGLSSLVPVLFGKEVKEHIVVNNWENGWILPKTEKSQRYMLIFVPQYLEYIGFILLIGCVMWILLLGPTF